MIKKNEILFLKRPYIPDNIDALIWEVSDKDRIIFGKIVLTGLELKNADTTLKFWRLFDSKMDSTVALMNAIYQETGLPTYP